MRSPFQGEYKVSGQVFEFEISDKFKVSLVPVHIGLKPLTMDDRKDRPWPYSGKIYHLIVIMYNSIRIVITKLNEVGGGDN